MKFVAELGFSDYFAESMKEILFDSNEFDSGVNLLSEGAEEDGRKLIISTLEIIRENVIFEAAGALESVLDNLPNRGGRF